MAIDQDAWKAAAALDRLACPKCLRSDKVEKVSHVVQSGGSSGLARQLRLPDPPRYQSPWTSGCSVWVLWTMVVIAVGSLFGFISTVVDANNPNPNERTTVPQAALGNLIVLGLLAFIIWRLAATARRRRKIVRLMTQALNKAKATWDHLYYCARDGGVFTPYGEGGGPFVEAKGDEVLRYLFDYGEVLRRAGLSLNDVRNL